MPATLGKIGELARHFHGEGGALLPPPYGIYPLAENQLLIRSSYERCVPHRSRTSRSMSAFDGEFNRSTQHYSLERSGHGAGAIPPLRAKILDTALVPRALGRRLPPIGRSSSALRALPSASA